MPTSCSIPRSDPNLVPALGGIQSIIPQTAFEEIDQRVQLAVASQGHETPLSRSLSHAFAVGRGRPLLV